MAEDIRQAALKALEVIMRPLVRFCLRHTLSFQDFVNTAKLVFVNVAADEIQKRSTKVNVSRISVMTGLYRKDVTKIFRDEEAPAQQAPSILGRVMAQWEQDKRFCSKPGSPRPLIWDGEKSEFNQLVRSVSEHVHPGTVLFELERAGTVKRTDDTVKLVRAFHLFKSERDQGLRILSSDIDSLITAAEQNLRGDNTPSNLHLRTTYDNIYLSDIPKIRQWLLDEGRLFHKKARDFLSEFDRDVSPRKDAEPAGGKVILGAYSLTESETKN